MKTKITCKLFNYPEIKINDKPILFPFTKINALFYYLLINKKVARDEIAGLLWSEKDEQSAKKNLRNAIYQGNKAAQMDLIISSNKSHIMLNHQLDFQIDTDIFLANPKENLHLYEDTFLKGFFLKDSETFEFWVQSRRSFFEKKFVEEYYEKITKDIAEKKFSQVEKNIQKLIYIDEFDERNYQLLMSFYQLQGANGKVIETYHNLTNLLNTELGIGTSNQTRKIYEKSLQSMNDKATGYENITYLGRHKELSQLENLLINFLENEPVPAVLIQGEAGVGKSSLINRAIATNSDRLLIFSTQSYQAEEKFSFKPWEQIIETLSYYIKKEGLSPLPQWKKLSTENMEDLVATFTRAIKELSALRKTIFFFKDIQWLDRKSCQLLQSIMLHLEKGEALFFFSARSDYSDEVDFMMTTLKRYDKLSHMHLQPLTPLETENFVKKIQPNMDWNHSTLKEIYTETEGNVFFITELLKTGGKFSMITEKMKNVLRNRFLNLSPTEQELIKMSSYFQNGVKIATLFHVMAWDNMDVIEHIETLVKKGILKEVLVNQSEVVHFTHVKFRQYIYQEQLISKRRIFHNQIATVLEKSISPVGNDGKLYPEIAYHYSLANNELKSIEYQLYSLRNSLLFYNELFPVYSNKSGQLEEMSFDPKQIQDHFNDLRKKLATIKQTHWETKTLQRLDITFLYIEGSYYIRNGDYEEGIKNIQKVLGKAEATNQPEYILESYKQLIYYYIQTHDLVGMSKYIELALDLAVRLNNHSSIGMLLRLKGLHNLMSGNTFLAEKLFSESINIFTVTNSVPEEYAISVAAAYNYIGEIRHIQKRSQEALEMFLKAIELCERDKNPASLSQFYINAGISHYARGEYGKAKDFFLKAYDLHGTFHEIWKRPQLDAYMALVHLQDENYEGVLKSIASSRKYAKKLNNPRDVGMVYFAQSIIRNNFVTSKVHHHELTSLLPKESGYYWEQAMKHLCPHRDIFERETLEKLFLA